MAYQPFKFGSIFVRVQPSNTQDYVPVQLYNVTDGVENGVENDNQKVAVYTGQVTTLYSAFCPAFYDADGMVRQDHSKANPNNHYVAPLNFSIQDAAHFADGITDDFNTEEGEQLADVSSGRTNYEDAVHFLDGVTLSEAYKIYSSYKSGAIYDYQLNYTTPFTMNVGHQYGFLGQFADIGYYAFCYMMGRAGVSLDTVEQLLGAINSASPDSHKGRPYGLDDRRLPAIEGGYQDGRSSVGYSRDGTSAASDFGEYLDGNVGKLLFLNGGRNVLKYIGTHPPITDDFGRLLSQNAQDAGAPTAGAGGVKAAVGGMGAGNHSTDPLVLDLNGAGINLTALSPNSPYFDVQNNGFARKTGWIGSGTGLLCVADANGHVTNITELFGASGSFANGFAALAALDSNVDGVINASDPVFGQLRVWVNPEGDGIVHPGELLTLAQLGITSINLNAVASNQAINGNTITLTSTYTLANGATRTIVDASLANSPTYTQAAKGTPVSAAVAALPELGGNGTLTDLRSAMMSDAALQGMVQALVANPSAATVAAVQAILLEWSGSSSIDPASRSSTIGSEMWPITPAATSAPPLSAGASPYFDARLLDFLEKDTGIAFNNAGYSNDLAGNPADPRWQAAISLREGWNGALDAATARLLIQSGYNIPEFGYNGSTDAVTTPTDLAHSLAALQQRLGPLTAANAGQWDIALRIADACRLDAQMSPLNYLAIVKANANGAAVGIADALAYGLQYTVSATGSVSLAGTTGQAAIYAGPGISLIQVLGGTDLTATLPTLDNEIVYAAGDGGLEIDQEDHSGAPANVLAFGPGITAAQLSFTADSSGNLFLKDGVTGDLIQLDDELGNAGDGVQFVTFADGSYLNQQQMVDLAHTARPDNTSLYGFSDNDTFTYTPGLGAVEINETGASTSSSDVLHINSGATAAQITATADSSGDVYLLDGTAGDRIELDGQLSSSSSGVQSITFADGTSLTRQQVADLVHTARVGNTTLYGFGSSDTFTYTPGMGAMEINETDYGATPSDVLQFGPGVTAAQITATADSSGNVYLFDGTAGDRIKLDGQLSSSSSGVQTIAFADGPSLTRQQVADLAHMARVGNTTLYGFGSSDTFTYTAGMGRVEIDETDHGATSSNTLQFGPGITPDQITVIPDYDGNIYLTLRGTNDQVKLDNQLSAGVQQVTFAGGTVWTAAQLLQQLTTTGTTGADYLYGTASADIFDGKGAPAGSEDYENGGGGGDTFIFNAGYGHLEVDETDYSSYPKTSTLQLGTGITTGNVTVTADSRGNAYISDGTAGDQVKIDNQFNTNYFGSYGIQRVMFADGTIWTAADLGLCATTGTPGADVLYGSNGADTFDGQGAPAGSQDYEQGRAGADTFVFNAGYGHLEVAETGYGSTLQLGTGISTSNLVVTADSGGNAYLSDGTPGDQIKLDGQIGNDFSDSSGVDTVAFSGGGSLSRQQIIDLAHTARPGNTVLYGFGSNYSTTDTFTYAPGSGAVEINESDSYPAPTDILKIGPGVTATQIEAVSDGAGNLSLLDGIAKDAIKLDGELRSGNDGVQSVVFSDGTSLTRAQLIQLAAVITGTTGADTLSGTTGANTFDGKGVPAGAQDYEQGKGGGDTFVFKAGYGRLEVLETNAAGAQPNALALGAGIVPGQVGVTFDQLGDATLTLGSGDTVVLDRELTVGNRVQQVRFSGGVTWSEQDLVRASNQVVGTVPNFLGFQGPSTFIRTSSGAVWVASFDGSGALAGSSPWINQNGTPVTVDATTTVVGGGEDFFRNGERTAFLLDGGALTAWAFDASGTLNAGQTLLQGVGAGTTVVGGGEDYFRVGARALFLRGADGSLQVDALTPGGTLLGGQALTNAGTHIQIDAATAVIGGGQDFFRNGDHTVFLRDNGALTAWGFDGSGALNAAQTLLPQGLDTASTVVGAGEDYFGIGGRAVFLEGVGGALTVDEFDDTGALLQTQALTGQDHATPISIDTATIIVGGEDFFGNGTRAVFLRGAGGQLNVWGFGADGAIQTGQLLTAQGSAVVIDTATTIAGGGEDFFGSGSRALFLRGGNGAVHAWAFDGYGALNAGLDLQSQGSALVVDTATSIIGGGEDFFGNGEHTLFVRGGNGALHAWAFDGQGNLNAGLDVTSQGSAVVVDTGTKVVGGGEDFFGTGDHVAFVRASNGGLSAWDINGDGSVNIREAFTLDGSTPLTIDTGTKVTGNAGDPFNTGGHAVYVQDSAGAQHVWEFNGSGVRTGVS